MVFVIWGLNYFFFSLLSTYFKIYHYVMIIFENIAAQDNCPIGPRPKCGPGHSFWKQLSLRNIYWWGCKNYIMYFFYFYNFTFSFHPLTHRPLIGLNWRLLLGYRTKAKAPEKKHKRTTVDCVYMHLCECVYITRGGSITAEWVYMCVVHGSFPRRHRTPPRRLLTHAWGRGRAYTCTQYTHTHI